MIILGIDPGLANTGWGLIECEGNRFRCVAYGCVTTEPGEDVPRRLKAVHDGIAELIGLHRPAECAIESLYFNINVRTAFATGQARGAALLATAEAGIPVGEYGPGEVKSAVVGTGSAEKSQVAYMVRAILDLAEEPTPDHAADALAIAIAHANLRASRARDRDAEKRAREAGASQAPRNSVVRKPRSANDVWREALKQAGDAS